MSVTSVELREAYELRDHYDESAANSWQLVNIEKYACAGSAMLCLTGASLNLAGHKKTGRTLFFIGAISSAVSEISLRRSTKSAQGFKDKADSIDAHIQELESETAVL